MLFVSSPCALALCVRGLYFVWYVHAEGCILSCMCMHVHVLYGGVDVELADVELVDRVVMMLSGGAWC